MLNQNCLLLGISETKALQLFPGWFRNKDMPAAVPLKKKKKKASCSFLLSVGVKCYPYMKSLKICEMKAKGNVFNPVHCAEIC